MHLVWADAVPGAGGPPDVRIFYRRSDDLGATWGSKMRLTPLRGYRLYPRIDGGAAGVHFTYYHEGAARSEVYHGGSTDRGRTWNGPPASADGRAPFGPR